MEGDLQQMKVADFIKKSKRHLSEYFEAIRDSILPPDAIVKQIKMSEKTVASLSF